MMRLGSFEVPYGEAWLLEIAFPDFIPLPFLAMSDDEIVRMFNRPSHRMTRGELLDTLCSLFDRGELLASQEVLGDHVPTRSQIEAALVPPVRLENGGIHWGSGAEAPLFYGLTPLGGTRWERMTEPDWSRYFEMNIFEEDVAEVTAGSPMRLEEVLEHSRELWGKEIPATGVERDTVAPWEVSHWKTLPVGYRARFLWPSASCAGYGATPEERRLVAGLRRWHRSIWDPPE